VILLIGSSGTLGSSLLSQIQRRKEKVLCLSRSKPSLQNSNVEFLTCDVSDGEGFKRTLAQVFNQRSIKAIIFNAAVSFQSKGLYEISDLQLKTMAEVNLLALTRLLQSLEANKLYFEETLRLIYVSSNSVDTLNASNPFYVACKAGSEVLVKNFGKKMGDKFTANIVRPGLMLSSLTEARFKMAEKEVVELSAGNRLASPDEISQVIVGLALDLPPTMTGQTISIDSGRTI
jgi:3-oxoacyl-[acyl-carrier protein] reductase